MKESKELPEWLVDQHQQAHTKIENIISVAMRNAALDTIKDIGLPDNSYEDWKYTDLANALGQDFTNRASEVKSAVTAQFLMQDLLPATLAKNHLVFVDGQFSKKLSATQLPQGVTLCNFQSSETENSALSSIKTKFGSAIKSVPTAFADINLACVVDGLGLAIAKDCNIKEPLVIVSLITSASNAKGVYPRILIHAESNSSINILEVAKGAEGQVYFNAAVTEFFLDEGASVNHYFLNLHSEAALNYNNIAVNQEKSSSFKTHSINLGAKLTRNDISAALKGEGGYSDICGLSLIKDSQHIDNHTLLDHIAPNCNSFELFKGVYADSARGVFDGTIIVRPDAQKTNAIQSNRSILLSDKATSYAKPQLKIWADDVKCTHGATVGQLDEQALFYLRTRGIAPKEANAMLLLAFVSEVVARIGCDNIKDYLQSLISERLSLLGK